MTITCFIRYEIDSFQNDQFKAHTDHWACIIPSLGGHLLGYFLPHQGSNYEAWGWSGKDERTFPQAVPAGYLQAPTGTIEAA